MAGQITVSVELTDGTKAEVTRHWTGGNNAYDGMELKAAAGIAAADIRQMIEATRGAVDDPVSGPFSRRGRGDS